MGRAERVGGPLTSPRMAAAPAGRRDMTRARRGPMPRLLLASQSPARIALCRAAGLEVEPLSPGVDEAAIVDPDPVALARARARAKAEAVAARVPEAWVIAADQVAWIGAEVFGKPRDPADHRRRLLSLRGRVHTLSTAVVLRTPATVRAWESHTRLKFRADLTEGEVDAYVSTGEGSGCAGGYAAEGLGMQLLEHIDGDWFNVLGLPMLDLFTHLRELQWKASFHLDPCSNPARALS